MSQAVSVLRLLLLVPIAYAVSCCIAAGIVVLALKDLVAFFGPVMFLVTPLLGGWVLFVLLAPAMILAVTVAEIRGWRSVLFWIPVGIVFAFVPMIPGFGAYADFLGALHIIPTDVGAMGLRVMWTANVVAILTVAGIAGGLVFWSMAGRYSGGGPVR